MKNNRRTFIEKLARENRNFYETPDGRGMLRAFELTFEHRWTYVFELVQNALDAGARSIALRLAEDGNALIFQHDGDCPLREKDIEGLSKIFRSTKGASSVGFMGIGFKSVFGRFLEARISGWGWTFRYEIAQVVGKEYGDIQPDLLGAVIPIWDDTIMAPDAGFTTRFELRRRANGEANLKADFAHILSDDDLVPLAILAMSGLRRLEMDGQIWELDLNEKSDGILEATAFSEDKNQRWLLFSVQFPPSREAVARFLEIRKIQPLEEDRDKVYAEAARCRRVTGVLPLDDSGAAAPPTRGKIHATLPTDVTLPFGLHVNADWLLNISRSGLKEIEDNAWQREIVDRIADVLARFLGWVAGARLDMSAAQKAFSALAMPTCEAGGLEALLAEESWLSVFRSRIENDPVLPIWAEGADTLSFAPPADTIVPPPPLASMFEKQPALRPTALLNGPVLREAVLGSSARTLMRRAGLLKHMAPRDLERAWQDGLKGWWEEITDHQEKSRDLLFYVWAAVAELASEREWKDSVESALPCARTVTGQWLPVRKVVFFNEAFPSGHESGGREVRQFISPFITDSNRLRNGWIQALRNAASNEGQVDRPLSRALKWVERCARRIRLREVIENAIAEVESSSTPDWSILAPLGHWAKHRNRSDLLVRVLVESEKGTRGILVENALLADPYVDRRQGRRHLFPEKPAVSADYLEQDPESADASEWRAFFERAGVKGRLEVRPEIGRAGRWERERVAKFLGSSIDDVGVSNDKGYELLDFDIYADFPTPDASEEVRKAVAPWLEDGYRALQKKGRRQLQYRYYEDRDRTGRVPSVWINKLANLAWVPCDDGNVRVPQHVLPRLDPGREDAPVAELSSGLLRTLEQEGLKFGAAIPEAPGLRKLVAAGSRLDAKDLAKIVRECLERIETDEDRGHLEQALRRLTVPSGNNKRVPLDRIVLRVGGGGGQRGALGGWIVPVDRIDPVLRAELEKSDFPFEFPGTTTGAQALGYIRYVWNRARSPSSSGLANEARDVLPTAYAYCLEDSNKDPSLSKQWNVALPDAAVFAEREWVILNETDDRVYLDDVNDRRFFPASMSFRTATGGHLGNSLPDQIRTAEELGLQLLSSSVNMRWREDRTLPITDDWNSRFAFVYQLLQRVRGSDGAGVEAETGPRLKRVRKLILEVGIESSDVEPVPVDARLHENVLTVAGRPVEFAADAAKELLNRLSYGQRAGLAADLTGLLGAIDNRTDFSLAAEKFRRSHAPEFELPTEFQPASDSGLPHGSDVGPVRTEDSADTARKGRRTAELGELPATHGESEHDKTDYSGGASASGVRSDLSDGSESSKSNSNGGSYKRSRALGEREATANDQRRKKKGEIKPDREDNSIETAGAESRSDEEYREAVLRYEKEFGRKPCPGDPLQEGWDIRSADPETRAVRLIEVKGKGRRWDGDEVVELSRAQARKAFEISGEGEEIFYLYVVEKTSDGYEVLPVKNPIDSAVKWILCGENWRAAAEKPKRIALA